MRTDAIQLEETRLTGVSTGEMPIFHERHRVFPQVFEDRQPTRVIDLAAGVGYVIQRVREGSAARVFANDISPTCLKSLQGLGVPVVSYTIDHPTAGFPFADGSFDAVIALATIEHVIHVDRFVQEVRRILSNGGHFYVSAPNYAGLLYSAPFLVTGKTFHDPLSPNDSYEFYAHVRYFTYRTLLEYISSFDLTPEAVYVPLPHSSTHYKALWASARWKAWLFRQGMKLFFRLSPRWCSEPVLCFRKGSEDRQMRKVIL